MYMLKSLVIFMSLGSIAVGLDARPVVYANNDFAIRFHRKLSQGNGNILFSPFSISVAMAMILRGSEDRTARELKDVMGYASSEVIGEEIHRDFGKILSALNKTKESYILNIANSLVVDKGFQLIDDYKHDMKSIYDALVLEVEFKNTVSKAVQMVNDWTRKQTNNMIPKFFDSLNPLSVLVIANAIYFKGRWLHEFDHEYTRPWKFLNHGIESQSKEVPMMFVKNKFRFVENEVFKALELPYFGEEVSMLVFLSKDNKGLSKLEEKLDTNFIEALRKQMTETEVEVSMPKFRVDYSKNLKETFKSLGLHKVFSSDGNFKQMIKVQEGLMISEIVHKAVLDVNEEGSEASAVSVAEFQSRCLRILPEFFVDHPFLFVIYHRRSDVILFLGRVEEL